MLPLTLRLPAGVILIACSALAFCPSIPLPAIKLPASRAAASRGSAPCMGAVESSAEERRSRRAIVFGAGLLPGLAVVLGGGNAAVAQPPPPRPKVTSIPDECKQVCVPGHPHCLSFRLPGIIRSGGSRQPEKRRGILPMKP